MQNYFSKNPKTGAALFQSIEAACEGLIYISEIDTQVVAFAGTIAESITGEIILQQAGREANESVEEASFGAFFDRLTAVKDWFGDAETARAEKFAVLQKLLEENLRGLRVFRIGKIQVYILAVGLDREGRVMGVTAHAVET